MKPIMYSMRYNLDRIEGLLSDEPILVEELLNERPPEYSETEERLPEEPRIKNNGDFLRMYLDSIGKFDLLGKEEEKELAIQIVANRRSYITYLMKFPESQEKIADMMGCLLNGGLSYHGFIYHENGLVSLRRKLKRMTEAINQKAADNIRDYDYIDCMHNKDNNIHSRYSKNILLKAIARRNKEISMIVYKIPGNDHFFESITDYTNRMYERKIEEFKRKINSVKRLKQREPTIEKKQDNARRRVSVLSAKKERYTVSKHDMVNANLRLVIHIAKEYTNMGMTLLDLIQEGNTGLIRSIEKYKPEYGNKFSTYAGWWIKQAIFRALREKIDFIKLPSRSTTLRIRIRRASRQLELRGRTPHIEEVAEQAGILPEEVSETIKLKKVVHLEDLAGMACTGVDIANQLEDKSENPEERFEVCSKSDYLAKLMDNLTFREAEILRMRHGIGNGGGCTQDDAGRHFNITRERARQIQAKAEKKLKRIAKPEDIYNI